MISMKMRAIAAGVLSGAMVAAAAYVGAGSAVAETGLEWPYCSPDAQAPTAEMVPPWAQVQPAQPPGSEEVWNSIIMPGPMDALVSPARVMVQNVEGALATAQVDISSVAWTTTFNLPETPLADTSIVAIGEGAGWLRISDALLAGQNVILGLRYIEGGSTTPGTPTFSLEYAVATDPATGTVDTSRYLAPVEAADRFTGQFEAFVNWSGFPLDTINVAEILTAWNVELDVPNEMAPTKGPLTLSFTEFWMQASGQDTGTPGDLEWWNKAPALCRSILDAPEAITRTLAHKQVWVNAPDNWQQLSDSVICLRSSVASLGCYGSDPLSTWPYLYWEGPLVVPGEDIEVQVARLKGEAVSWVERTNIGTISWDALNGTGYVLVELPPLPGMTTYDQIANHPDPSSLATIRSISVAEHEAIQQGTPPATVEP